MSEKPTYEALEERIAELEQALSERERIIQNITVRLHAEDSLRASNERAWKILQTALDGFWLTDTKGNFLEVNDAYVQMSGYSTEELMNMKIFDIEAAENHEAVARHIQSGIATGFGRFKTVHRRKDNSIYDVEVNFSYLPIEGGRFVVFLRDITERMEAEKSLVESEARYRSLVEMFPEAVLVHQEGIIKYINRNGANIFGSAHPGELIGKPVMELIHPDFYEATKSRIERAYHNQETLPPADLKYVGTDKHVIDVEATATSIDYAGKPAILSVIRDVTKQRQSLKELWASTERFQKVFNSQPDAIFVLNSEMPARVLESNKAATTIFGYESDEMIGETIDKLHVNDAYRESFQRKLFPAIKQQGYLNNLEFSMRRKDGTVFPSEHTVLELKNDVGERTGWVSIVRDLTERKEIGKRLQQAQKMESIGSLAGGIAHDFNNILFPIIGMSELLLEDLPSDSAEYENTREILKAGKRGSDLVKQILAFSRQTEQQMIPVRIQSILKEILKLIRSTIPSNIEISQDIQTDCGLVMADPTQVHQIGMNLITNAYHAMEQEAGGKISVQLKETTLGGDDPASVSLEPGPYAVLSVFDNGCGITPAVMDRIFEPYFTTKATGKGTGLGLAVVFGIVKEHHGDINVCSEVGTGTTFTVYLPLMKESAETVSVGKVETCQTGNERILLVDDEEPIVRLESQMLERLGYRVTCRTSSVEALKAFAADPEVFDLVITDMTMPNMTGDQLAKELISIRPAIPVIICTGFSERINREKTEALGIKAFLMKPVVRSDMAQMVRSLLDEAKVSI
jgi:PAS domain S-box-containing protein